MQLNLRRCPVPVMIIPVAVLPVWALAVANLVTACIFLTYCRSFWHRLARALVRATFWSSCFWAVSGLLFDARTAATAASWDRFYLPLGYLTIVGLVEATLRIGHRPVSSRLFWALWAPGLFALLLFSVPAASHWIPMVKVPDGFWLADNTRPWWLVLARTLIFGGGWALVMGLLWDAARERGERRLKGYFAAAVLAGPLAFNDGIWSRHHLTPFPALSWVGLGVLAIMWWELYAAVRQTHALLDTDAATQAASRRYGEAYGARALEQHNVAVIYGDLDRFKEINDQLGHATGDLVLREVVHRLGNVTRAEDAVVRLGGDEFLVILPGSGRAEEEAMLARFSKAVSAIPMRLRHGGPSAVSHEPLTIHMSLGWAWAERGSSFEDLLERADSAMYAQKRQRRTASRGDLNEPMVAVASSVSEQP